MPCFACAGYALGGMTWFAAAAVLGLTLWGQAEEPKGGKTYHIHVGAFEVNTQSARAMAPEVADLLGQQLRAHHGTTVTEEPLQAWLDPMWARHEGLLLKCMNPYWTRRQVITCVEGLSFPPAAQPLAAEVEYVLRGALTTQDVGVVVSLELCPVQNGQVGSSVQGTQLVLTGKMRRPARLKAVADALGPLFDTMDGKPAAGKKGGR